MFIKNLMIKKDSEIIRDIPFKKGINLIVDETKLSDKTGNNVGKTTVLRLVDYCLGGSGTNIYTDQEFKGEVNSTIENFLKNNNVIISLVLVDNLEDDSSKKIVIERNFLDDEKQIATINGEQFADIVNEFCPKLSNLIFNYEDRKPTFRQIVAKNIRDEKNKLKNTLKVLHSTTKSEEYEALFLFWLGIRDGSFADKQKLEKRKKNEADFQTRFKKEGSLSEIRQAIVVLSKKIDELEEIKKKNFEYNENHKTDLEKLNQIRTGINRISTTLGQLELRRDLILESKQSLDEEMSKLNVNEIHKFYEEAGFLIPNLQKSFDEVYQFHNSMINEKIKYILEELPDLEKNIKDNHEEINGLLDEEKSFVEKIKKLGLFIELESLISELNNLHERKGKLLDKEEIWVKSLADLKETKEKLMNINEALEKQEDLIQERITKLNLFFSEISTELYGQPFIISSDKDEKGCYTLKVSGVGGNLGTGVKKGQIIAFDFAYINFADSINMDCLHFIMHDQIENVHNTQIDKILTNLVNQVNCQYILPVLRDKLPKDIDVKPMEILSLSESKKLFKI